jgi:Tol biopolymer transport system component
MRLGASLSLLIALATFGGCSTSNDRGGGAPDATVSSRTDGGEGSNGGEDQDAAQGSDDAGALPDVLSVTPPVDDADTPSSDAGPGGPWVAFVSRHSGSFALYLTHLDGTGLHAITGATGATDLAPSWSPDGAKIAFQSTRASDAGVFGIFVIDVASGAVTPLANDLSEAVSPAWSPDGTSIAVEGSGGLYLIPADGGASTVLTSGGYRDNSPAWSSNGVVYFASNRGSGGSFDVWSVEPDGGNLVQVTIGTGILGGPALSRDGATLALAESDVVTTDGGPASTGVVFVDLDAGTVVTFTAEGDDQPAFDPSGSMLAVSSTRYATAGGSENPQIVLLGVPDASSPFRLWSDPADQGQPAFQPAR